MLGRRSCALIACGALALSGVATAGSGRTETVTCADQSFGRFHDAYDKTESVVVGPLSIVDAGRTAQQEPVEDLESRGGTKRAIIIRNGHRAVITVDAEARDYARITHAYRSRSFERKPVRLRLRGCKRGHRSGSRANGRRVTFWPGWIALRKAPACVPIHVRIDGRAPRARTLRFGTNDC